MSSAKECPLCGGRVPADAPEGLCPVCLLAGALSPGDDETPVPEDPGAELDMEASGLCFGPYTTLGVLGEGGMGIVYLARQQEPIKRDVALKVIRPGMNSGRVIARFEAERQALAQMEHPGIARVFDAGETPDGRPYFALEYVPGTPITQFCDEHRLTVGERLSLFRQVCLAVHHAHQKGIIHRDLKPSNVLVTLQDGAAVPKIIDFGIAKAAGPESEERRRLTEQGMLIGTPEYMSPEQAELGAREVDASTDIYSLGVVLYELLVGALPLELGKGARRSYLEILSAVREQEPQSPRTRLGSSGSRAAHAAASRGTDLKSLRKLLRGDLEWILLRAMEKESARRYPSASEFAADIARHLNDEPVLASPPSRIYRARKFIRKHRIPFAAAVAVLLSLVGGLALSISLYFSEQSQRDIAERQGYSAALAGAEALIDSADYAGARERLYQCAPRLRGWEWRLLYALSDTSIATLQAGDQISRYPAYTRFAFDRDQGRTFFHTDRTVYSWKDTDFSRRPEAHGIFGRILAISGNGSVIATRTRPNGDAALSIVDPRTGMTVGILRDCPDARTAAFSPDQRRLATAAEGGALSLWDLGSGEVLHRTTPADPAGQPALLSFSPDGRRLAVSVDRSLRLFETETGTLIRSVRMPEAILALEHHPLAHEIAVADAANRIRIWNPAEPGHLGRGWTESDKCLAIAFSPDGRRLATAAQNGAIRVWDSADGLLLANLTGSAEHETIGITFSPDGRMVLAGSRRGSIRIWDVETAGAGSVFHRHAQSMSSSPGGRHMVAVTGQGFELFDSASGRFVRRFEADCGSVVAISTGLRLACSGPSGRIATYDARTGAQLQAWSAHRDPTRSLAFGPGGQYLASGSNDGSAIIWQAEAGKPVAKMELPAPVNTVVFSPDERLLATAAGSFASPVAGGAVYLWEVPSGRLVRRFSPEFPWGEVVGKIAFSPDGKRIAAGSSLSGTVRIQDVSTGRVLAELEGRASEVSALSFSPDGRMLASSSRDNTIRLWDAEQYTLRYALRRPVAPASSLVFSADGSRLYAAFPDGTLRAWSTATSYTAEAMELAASLLRQYSLWADVRHHLDGAEKDDPLAGECRRLCAFRPDLTAAFGELVYRSLVQPDGRGVDLKLLLRRCEDLHRILPSSLDAAAYHGGALYRNGLHRQAIAKLAPASAAHPENAEADVFLAMAYAATGRTAEARDSLERAREILKSLSVAGRAEIEPLLREAQAIVYPAVRQ